MSNDNKWNFSTDEARLKAFELTEINKEYQSGYKDGRKDGIYAAKQEWSYHLAWASICIALLYFASSRIDYIVYIYQGMR